MLRSPRATLQRAVARPRSLDLGALIVVIATICSVGFLMTPVGRLAALDQEVRQLESVGTVVSDEMYDELRRWQPYRPGLSAAGILIGWPVLWFCGTVIVRTIGNRTSGTYATFAQVLTVVVHASSVFAVRSVVATPLNYARESLGGATSLGLLVPGLGESTFAARLLGAVDVFVLWWVILLALGLNLLYQTRTAAVARWLFGAYAAGAAALALTQVFRGGI
jgi:hypothetical protein